MRVRKRIPLRSGNGRRRGWRTRLAQGLPAMLYLAPAFSAAQCTGSGGLIQRTEFNALAGLRAVFRGSPLIGMDTASNPYARTNIVMVGLMGAGKSSVGRRLAAKLGKMHGVDPRFHFDSADLTMIPSQTVPLESAGEAKAKGWRPKVRGLPRGAGNPGNQSSLTPLILTPLI